MREHVVAQDTVTTAFMALKSAAQTALSVINALVSMTVVVHDERWRIMFSRNDDNKITGGNLAR